MDKTKEQLLEEITKLRQRVAELEESEARLKQADKLIESEEGYHILVENVNEAILVIQDGILKFANSKAMKISSYSEEELILKPFLKFVHPDDQKMLADRYSRRIRGEEVPNAYSFRVISKDGGIIWVEVSAVLIKWEGRSATLNFLTDITERKQSEQALREG